MHAHRQKRRRRQRRQEHRVGVSQRQRMRVEHVRAEERARIAAELVEYPPEPPDRKKRISQIRNRIHPLQLRKEQHGGKDREAGERDRARPPRSPNVDRYDRVLKRDIHAIAHLAGEGLDASKRTRPAVERDAQGHDRERREQGAIGAPGGQPLSPEANGQTARQRNHRGQDDERQGHPVEGTRRPGSLHHVRRVGILQDRILP